MKKYRDIVSDGGSRIIDQVSEKLTRLNERMMDIKHKVAVMSGKGGVGKSTITAILTATIAKEGFKVGILDADLNGPSISKMLGIKDTKLDSSEYGIAPAIGPFVIKMMSMDLFLPSSDAPVTWDGPAETHPWIGTMEASTLRELLADTVWGKLDFLFIDLPPVLSRINDLASLLPGLSGAIIVTIPSEVSQEIVLKSIMRVGELNIPIIGIIENMRGYTCRHCGRENPLFTEQDTSEAMGYAGVPYLGRVPFNRDLAILGDVGLSSYLMGDPYLPMNKVFSDISRKVLRYLGVNKQGGMI